MATGYELLTERAGLALDDPSFRLATQAAAWVVAMEVVREPQQPPAPEAASMRTVKRRALANQVIDDPLSATNTTRLALAVASDMTVTQSSTPAQFFAAMRAAWDTVARVHPEDAPPTPPL